MQYKNVITKTQCETTTKTGKIKRKKYLHTKTPNISLLVLYL